MTKWSSLFPQGLIVGAIVIFAFIIRLVNLNLIPVFADEAIYIRWSQVMRAESTLRFIPQSDGKQPLFMWLTMPSLKIFSDPLIAGRTISVISGTATVLGVGMLSFILFNNVQLSIIASLLAAISPFLFFFDRLALADSLLASLGVWTFIFAVLTAKTLRLDLAMITGILLGLSLLTKTPGQVFLLLLPIAVIFVKTSKSNLTRQITKFAILIAVSISMGFAMYNVLRLGPEFHMIAMRNKDYVFSLSEILQHPLNPLVANLKTSFSYYWYFFTPPILVLSLVGIYLSLKKFTKETVFLVVLIAVPLIGQSLIAKVLTARYVLYPSVYLLIFAAAGLTFATINHKLKKLLLLSVAIWPLLIIYKLVTSPQSLNLPRSERSGYFELWTAGYGIKETADYLRQLSQSKEKMLVGTEGYFGTLPNGLQMYLNDVRSITIIGTGLNQNQTPEPLLNSLKDQDVFFLVNDSRLLIKDYEKAGLVLLATYPKALPPNGTRENLLFFKVGNPR